MKQNTLAMAALAGLCVFLWYFSAVLSDLNAWNAWDQPAEVAKMIKAGVFGLIAFASAMGMDVRKFLSGVGITFGAPAVAEAPASKEIV